MRQEDRRNRVIMFGDMAITTKLRTALTRLDRVARAAHGFLWLGAPAILGALASAALTSAALAQVPHPEPAAVPAPVVGAAALPRDLSP